MKKDWVHDWFSRQGWTPFPFQEQAWDAYRNARSGLIHIPTGAGKTYSVFFGPLREIVESKRRGLQLLYITPLRAVARDIEKALRLPVEQMGLNLRVESRTG